MRITFFSFLMSYIAMTFLILVFFVFRYYLKMKYRIRDLLLILIICIGRTILPMEFSFTKVVPMSAVYNTVIIVFNHKVIGGFSVKHILMLIWGIGTIVFLARCVYSRRKLYNYVSLLTDDITDAVWKKYGVVFDRFGKRLRVNVYESDSIAVPYSFGILRKGIVLPKESEEKERYYYLMHEYGHHVHNDLLIMLIIDCWLAFFWWSPFSYFLRHKMEETLELNCDYMVTKNMTGNEKKTYLQSIISVLKIATEDKKLYKASTMGLVRFNKKKFVLERFENVTKRKAEQNKLLSIIFYLAVGIIVASSYTFVFQSSFPIEENDEYGYVVDSIYYDEEKNRYYFIKDGVIIFLSNEEAEVFESLGIELEEKE